MTTEEIKLLMEIAEHKGFVEGFDKAKEMYDKYILLPKCYACDKAGTYTYFHQYGSEHSCKKHSNETELGRKNSKEFNNI